jgi:hypothetical protein
VTAPTPRQVPQVHEYSTARDGIHVRRLLGSMLDEALKCAPDHMRIVVWDDWRRHRGLAMSAKRGAPSSGATWVPLAAKLMA